MPPNGWSGATIRCHKNNFEKIKTNTSIGLLIHISKNYRDKKVSTLEPLDKYPEQLALIKDKFEANNG